MDSVLNYVKLVIQPIIFVAEMKIKYGEVLIRTDLEGGVLKLIQCCEENGMSCELDKFVLSRTCAILKRCEDRKMILTVNLCKDTIRKKGIYVELADVIKSYGIEKDRLILELNEMTEFKNGVVMENIRGFYREGIGLAIDDFGMGIVNYRDILNTNVRLVKFDKIYLNSEDSKKVNIRDTISNIHRLGIDTAIEGIETKEEFNKAVEIGFNNVQGFLFSRAVDIDSFVNMLNKKFCIKEE